MEGRKRGEEKGAWNVSEFVLLWVMEFVEVG
jgi:hypothetical protein